MTRGSLLVETVDALAQLRQIARDAWIARLEHGEALQDIERARQISVAAVDPGEVDEDSREDLALARGGDDARLEDRVGGRGLPEERLEIGGRERASARERIEEQPRILDRDPHE